MEGGVYNGLGCIALDEGTEEGVKTAVVYFEKYREISKAIGFGGATAAAESNIAVTKSKYGGGSKVSTEEYLENRRKYYKQFVATFGERDQATIKTGLNLAIVLHNADHGMEAERALSKLAAACKRVHGPDHGLTKEADSNLLAFKVRHSRA